LTVSWSDSAWHCLAAADITVPADPLIVVHPVSHTITALSQSFPGASSTAVVQCAWLPFLHIKWSIVVQWHVAGETLTVRCLGANCGDVQLLVRRVPGGHCCQGKLHQFVCSCFSLYCGAGSTEFV
jgi:hypothetical protein